MEPGARIGPFAKVGPVANVGPTAKATPLATAAYKGTIGRTHKEQIIGRNNQADIAFGFVF